MSTKEEDKLSSTAVRFCRRFSLAEIQLATQDFSEAHLIGNGGFGKVYKGQIDNEQQIVAIKRLALNSNQGEGEFLTEIETLSKLRHINLVSLIGYCNEKGEMILVYEYMALGTLADHLYKISRSSESDNFSSLTWKQRLNICIGAGRGLDYLHTGRSIIHRDVKSTNILLDTTFTAKVSDFGLAKHLNASSSKSYVSTMVKGTFGYLDPSYFITGRLTRKSDTYAFGVVLLEVLCGRPPVDPRLGEDEVSLAMWALEKINKGKVGLIVASNLRDEISADCLKNFLGVAKRCLNHEPKKRPTMGQVVVQLEFALELQDEKAPTLYASRFLPFWNRIKPPGNHATGSTQQDGVNMLPVAAPAIPIHELKDITHNFRPDCLIDKRPGGVVYRGTLKSGQDAAIKKLYYRSLPDKEFRKQVWPDSLFLEEVRPVKGFQEQVWTDNLFLEQVSLVSSLKHENVAQPLGYCVDGRQQFLVYEFAQHGSLHDILQGDYGSEPVAALSWGQRVKISVGAAQGLEYIHEKAQIHCNIRSSNVLVYNDEVVKLADFGLSTRHTFERLDEYTDYDPSFFDHTEHHPSFFTRTHDYHPPEYIRNNEVSWRGDVYSFGLVLLQLLSGRSNSNSSEHILKWASPKLNKRRVRQVVDHRLNGDYPRIAVEKMAAVAASCVKSEGLRPEMRGVVMALRSLLNDGSAKVLETDGFVLPE